MRLKLKCRHGVLASSAIKSGKNRIEDYLENLDDYD